MNTIKIKGVRKVTIDKLLKVYTYNNFQKIFILQSRIRCTYKMYVERMYAYSANKKMYTSNNFQKIFILQLRIRYTYKY